ncbi:MAG: hypothetical protein V4721_15565 [Bacteroidota bacterium]
MKNCDKNHSDTVFSTVLMSPGLSEVDEDWRLIKSRLKNQRGGVKSPIKDIVTIGGKREY